MRGISGVGQSVDVFLVTLEIGPITISGVRIVGNPHGNELIIGRDVLNQFVVTLNGLAGEVTIDT